MNDQQNQSKSGKPKWLRVVLRISRFLLVPVLGVLALLTGLLAGFVYIGGQPMSEALQWNTWRHVFDLVFKAT
ncbi:hypothetical protein SY83_10845 [Paenibacillus swuensis]|uniref:DNA-directed RNA polymerase subunit beta n=1 Tax=Paenibacillus swuensis TaxID=1178515 RepID=A0A172TIA3_9BACL|nr:DNA-directed RNA polymerase subunit beta [Paenibacillus swuensis]ANE46686.1 hypothetical protein SY83_10845 [Paenibacillus swuensis]